MTDLVATRTAFAFQRRPLPALQKHPEPGWLELHELHNAINANAISVHSNSGNGALGFLTLTVPPATYLEQSGNIPYVAPTNPGVHPVHLAGAAAAQIAETNRDHQTRTHLFDQHNAVEQALKEQLLATIPDEFIWPLANELTQYATVLVLTILTHRDTRYGHITNDQLLTNKEHMNRMWSPTDSIDSFWRHIHQCHALATAAVDPISDRTTMASVLPCYP
jgi:hypothetical protein